MKPARVARYLAEKEVLDAPDQPGALLEPVERIERDVLELLAARGRRYCGTSIGYSQADGPSTCTPGTWRR